MRLDDKVKELFNISKTKAQKYIREGIVKVDDKIITKPGYILKDLKDEEKNNKEKYNIDNRFINMEKLYLIIIFLGGFTFHILWEAKSRYIIPYVIILFPLATGLIDVIINNKIVNKIKLLNPYIKEKEDKKNNN